LAGDYVPNNAGVVTKPYGLDAAVDEVGNLTVALAAGGPGASSCGSSDLVVAKRTPGGAWHMDAPVQDSSACCSICDQAACCAPGSECTSGTDVGAWAAVALDSSNRASIAYVDYHFLWDHNSRTWEGFELWGEALGRSTGIRPSSGLGRYADFQFVGTTAVAACTRFGGGGLHILRRTGAAGAGDAWTQRELLPGHDLGERIAMEVAPDGITLGVLVHVASDTQAERNDLLLCESSDGGATWPAECDSIDEHDMRLGFHPSLAYDAAGRPHVSYYSCGSTSGCPSSSTRLRYAWRERVGKWWTSDVVFDPSAQSGLYSQIALDTTVDPPTPMIVFQNLTTGAAMSARGTFVP
jgi:hypothetical protein